MSAKKILIVDDDQNILNLIKIGLSDLGFEVEKASTGKEAVAKAKELLPDLLLMDVMLSDMNGAEVVKALDSDPQTKDMPSIFMTGMIVKGESEEPPRINIGGRMQKAIAKPIDIEELKIEVKKILGL